MITEHVPDAKNAAIFAMSGKPISRQLWRWIARKETRLTFCPADFQHIIISLLPFIAVAHVVYEMRRHRCWNAPGTDSVDPDVGAHDLVFEGD